MIRSVRCSAFFSALVRDPLAMAARVPRLSARTHTPRVRRRTRRPLRPAEAGAMTNNTAPQTRTTAAFQAQAWISFGLALLSMVFAVLYLPVDPWIRAFLGLGTLYLTTSAFTLAKCIRDQQEQTSVVSRVDQARLDKLLAEHDPFRVVS
jgi:hypothetical protein